MIPDQFYKAFEDKYRGSEAEIKARLAVYFPLLDSLAARASPVALDLGCGRGEWLGLLAERGFQTTGIDLDAAMVAVCREKTLPVTQQDALTALRAYADQQLSLITGFHIAEHLPFESLLKLIQEAHRVLVHGGVLILETPNPENISVGTYSFYTDPTHARPLPPNLLSFLCEYASFEIVKVVRVNAWLGLKQKESPTLRDVIWGTSPDYAVVAQKKGGDITEAMLGLMFTDAQNVGLEQLVSEYDSSLRGKLQHINALAEQAAQVSSEAIHASQHASQLANESLAMSKTVYNSKPFRFMRWFRHLFK